MMYKKTPHRSKPCRVDVPKEVQNSHSAVPGIENFSLHDQEMLDTDA